MQKTIRMLVVVAAALVLGCWGRTAQAETPRRPHAKTIQLPAGMSSAVKSPLIMGIIALGTYPPTDSSGGTQWPCFTGGTDPDCSSIPAGGIVLGIPYQDWNLSDCTSGACGQVYWSFTSNSASGSVMVSETITQGNNVVYQSGLTNLGPGTAPFLTFVWDEIGLGPTACNGCVAPVRGAAKITTTATVGSTTITGHTWIDLQ
ncbi:MAG TPA: hypothetical protein VMI94_12020 [Bryobacteraceae bacterium]|nr:hypothetical protein [Bryobacteraceae bacterium]